MLDLKSLCFSRLVKATCRLGTLRPTALRLEVAGEREDAQIVISPGTVLHRYVDYFHPREAAGCLKRHGISLLLGLALIHLPATVFAKPLSLEDLFEQVAASHPLMLGARDQIRASESDVSAAKLHWWPKLSAVLESDPGATFAQPSRALQLEQTLWDAGRVQGRVSEAASMLEKSRLRLEGQREDLFIRVITAWSALLAAQDRTHISEEALNRLRKLEGQMLRRVEVNASPQIDLELVFSRIRQAEIDLVSAKSALQTAASRLEQLSGIVGIATRVDTLLVPSLANLNTDALDTKSIEEAATRSSAVLLARSDVDIARAKLETKKAEKWPEVYLRATKYLGSASGAEHGRPAFFLGLRYTPSAGFASEKEADSLVLQIGALEQTVEAAYRESIDQLSTDRVDILNARERMEFLADTVVGSTRVLDSYSRQFTAGRKTWIDLLNAVRELSQNQFAQAETRAAMLAAFYRLQIRMGRSLLNRDSR